MQIRQTGASGPPAFLLLVAGILTDGEADHETFPWEQLRYQHTAAVRTVLQEQYAPATANKILSALRGVLEEAWQLQLMSSEDYHRARHVRSIKGTSLKKGRHIARQELRELFAACAADPSVGGRRDAAILATLYGGGLRRAEIVALELRDLPAMAQSSFARPRAIRAGSCHWSHELSRRSRRGYTSEGANPGRCSFRG